MNRRSGSGGGGYGGGRYDYNSQGYGGYGGYDYSQMSYERDFMDEMAFRREMMQRGMMNEMGFYYNNPMGNYGYQGGMSMNQRQNRGGGNRGDMRNKMNNRGSNQRRDGRDTRTGPPARNNRQEQTPSHQRRLSDMRSDRDQSRRRDRDQQQWERRGGPQNLQVKESGPLGKIKAISRRIKEWGNFGHGLPYWTKRANIYRRFSNFLERGHLDHTIVFLGHGSDCVCRLYVDGLYLAEGAGGSKSEARSDAFYRAVERLRVRNFDQIIKPEDKFTVDSLRGYEVDQVISESPSNSLTYESNYAHIATNRVADFSYSWDKLVIVERAGMTNAGLKLRLSANLNGMLLDQNTSKAVPPGETKPKWKFAISLENKLLSEVFHERQGIARANACVEAMKKLDPICWRLKIQRHRFPKLRVAERRGGPRRDEKKGDKKDDKKDEKKEDKTEDKKEEPEAEKKDGDNDGTKEDKDDLDQTKEEEKEEDDEEHENDDEPFVPPVADLRRSDLVDPESTKDDKEEEKEEEKEGEKEEVKEEKEEVEATEETEEKEMETDEKKEDDKPSKAELKLKQKIENEAKQRKKAEFLFKIRKALEEKLTAFAASRSFGQLILEGFWMEERDLVVRLCRKLNMRSYVDKYRNEEGKIIHYIFVSQIIPMEEVVSTLKATKDMTLGNYTLLPPKSEEEIAEQEKEEAERNRKREERMANSEKKASPEEKTSPEKK